MSVLHKYSQDVDEVTLESYKSLTPCLLNQHVEQTALRVQENLS